MMPYRILLALAASAVAPFGAVEVVESEPTGEISTAERVVELRASQAAAGRLFDGSRPGPGPAPSSSRVGPQLPATPPATSRVLPPGTADVAPTASWLLRSGPTAGHIDLPPPHA